MPSAHILAPELEAFRQEFGRLSAEVEALAGALSDEQFNWRPAPERWSVAQCIEHLNATARAYQPMLDDGISEAIRRGLYGSGPFRYSLIGRLFVRSLEPPAKRRFRAPPPFQPPPERARSQSVPAFKAYQTQYVDRLRQANGLDLARARVRSPVAAWLRLPLGSAFLAMLAHERRHLWQARQVIESPGFPIS
ncbi:MAG: DinB family protein [Acidimicrobiia bacterium]|nr:DinB family protein [Acidimicrobiia bacterium]